MSCDSAYRESDKTTTIPSEKTRTKAQRIKKAKEEYKNKYRTIFNSPYAAGEIIARCISLLSALDEQALLIAKVQSKSHKNQRLFIVSFNCKTATTVYRLADVNGTTIEISEYDLNADTLRNKMIRQTYLPLLAHATADHPLILPGMLYRPFCELTTNI